MKIITALTKLFAKQKMVIPSIDDYKQQARIQQGKMQFEKLLKKGLSIPVALL